MRRGSRLRSGSGEIRRAVALIFGRPRARKDEVTVTCRRRRGAVMVMVVAGQSLASLALTAGQSGPSPSPTCHGATVTVTARFKLQRSSLSDPRPVRVTASHCGLPSSIMAIRDTTGPARALSLQLSSESLASSRRAPGVRVQAAPPHALPYLESESKAARPTGRGRLRVGDLTRPLPAQCRRAAGAEPAGPPPLAFKLGARPRPRPGSRVYGITSNTLVRSGQSPSGPAGGASDGYGPP